MLLYFKSPAFGVFCESLSVDLTLSVINRSCVPYPTKSKSSFTVIQKPRAGGRDFLVNEISTDMPISVAPTCEMFTWVPTESSFASACLSI